MPGSTRSYEMARRLVENGHTVYMVTTKRDLYQIHKSNYTCEDGIHIFWLPVKYSNNMSFMRRILSFVTFSLLAVKQGNIFKADMIFATSTPLTIAVPAIMLKKLKHIPLVFEVRDLWPELPIAIGALKSKMIIYLAKKLEKMTYCYSTKIIALSNGMKKGISRAGFPDSHISVIPNFCDIKKFSIPKIEGIKFRNKFPWIGNNPLIVYCGAFGIINGVSYLVKVAAEMKKINKNICFLIMGEGKDKKTIRHIARQSDVLNKNFYMLDPIPKSDIPNLLSAATIVTSLFIDLKEMENNSANKFFDGLAAGKPIMINYRGWQKELLETNRAGIFVPFDNPQEGAKRLNDLIQNKDRLKKYSHSAKQLAREKFSLEYLYNQFELTLQKAAKW